jgi:hypothetical protein
MHKISTVFLPIIFWTTQVSILFICAWKCNCFACTVLLFIWLFLPVLITFVTTIVYDSLITFVTTTVYDAGSYANRGLLELSLIFCPRIQNSAFLEIGRGCSLLRTLYLVDCSSISDSALCHVAQGCKNLTELSIRRGYEVLSKFLWLDKA